MTGRDTDFATFMPDVAVKLLGKPTKTTKNELRFGTFGSVSVDLEKGVWRDHENKVGGGVLDLIAREKGTTSRGEGVEWLRQNGYEVDNPPANRKNGRHLDGSAQMPTHDQTAQMPLGKIVATYDYVDEAGDLVFQVVRYEPKSFRQRRKDAGGRWVWNATGVREIPYRLPEILEAIALERRVFFVEGEKDADNLWRIGIPATTNRMGANKWPEHFSEFFKGANVTIIPDNDEAGRKHRDLVGSSLAAAASSVRVLELPDLPDKGDVSDWLAAGGTVEQLNHLVDTLARPWSTAAVPSKFHLVAFDDIRLGNTRRDIIKGLVPAGGMTLVYGPPKCGKSFVVSDAMYHVALEWNYRGRRVQQGPVVYLALEGGEGFKARVEAFRRHRLTGNEHPPFYLVATSVDLVADHKALIAAIADRSVKPLVVVVDTLNRPLVGSESNDEDMARYIRAADAIREAFQCAVVIIHHSGLEKGRPRGHTSLAGAADSQIKVERDTDGNIVMTLEWMKDGAEDGNPIVSRLEQVEVGTDLDGETITSCIVTPVDVPVAAQRPKPKTASLTKGAKIALKALNKALAEGGVDAPTSNHVPAGVKVTTFDHWRTYAYRMGISSSGEDRARQMAFKRAADHLTASENIGVWDDNVWLAK